MPLKAGNFDKLKKIGDGTYGAVYKARNAKTREWVALKRMYIDEEDEEGIPSTTIREIAILKQLSNHPNIVRLSGTFFERNDLYLIFELFQSDLKQYLNEQARAKKLPLSLSTVQNLMHQILSGIAYCHSLSVMHRDIKPQNILINHRTQQIKITDFGLSRCYILPNKTWTHEIITLWYRPPEVLLGTKRYSIYVDIWSIGCLFAELCNNNKPLFRGCSEITQIMEIFMKCGTPNFADNGWTDCLEHCREFDAKYPKWHRKPPHFFCSRKDIQESHGLQLMDAMLALQPNQRITPKHALQHPFFDAYRLKMSNAKSSTENDAQVD
mmetsp:Transcript_22883/g.36518  ORF Transcript_22883/g.36518 Transcript_22883/m.36518 type:complete len:325 (-) Transcript_22883:298-1272(-)|eukprot:CAMPEP_0197055138 /NCGR_PEP_ID=MMETSP1384-20130603/57819_1 /TAXON_ID=29189 /ORGANISM="Ammonia sp." /LENGTH=324 /DNA_ID=CAMNT_0042488605 /DNA_START=88 /DNA_END=1062 /DNA_ORIENTATION=-